MIPYILTYSGKNFKHSQLNPDDICIEDIAHALSLVCRFGGHCREFYSVAQHSVLVSSFCLPQHAFVGLMHDASEAYLGDMSSPLKKLHSMYEYRALELDVMNVISKKFEFEWPEPPEVKYTDLSLLATEGRDLFGDNQEYSGYFQTAPTLQYHIVPWSPKIAEEVFLNRFYELKGNNEKAKAKEGTEANSVGL